MTSAELIENGDFLIRPIISVGQALMGVFTYEVKDGRAVLINNAGLDYIYNVGDSFDLDDKLLKKCELQKKKGIGDGRFSD